MGYKDGVLKAECGGCGSQVYWDEPWELTGKWTCRQCQTKNFLKKAPAWPHVPPFLFIGHQKERQLKLYPLPPDDPRAEWARPYCTRSFMSQVSRRLGGCAYTTEICSRVMDEPVFADRCSAASSSDQHSAEADRECHVMAGFSIGALTCPLWEQLTTLCQTEREKSFLRTYLELVKDRVFPMLIPQPRIGIAERRRPDFVVFAPVHFWRYKWYAIELDGGHPSEQASEDRLRNDELAVLGYTVVSVQGSFKDVKLLVEQIERDMRSVNEDPFDVALRVEVRRTEPAADRNAAT